MHQKQLSALTLCFSFALVLTFIPTTSVGQNRNCVFQSDSGQSQLSARVGLSAIIRAGSDVLTPACKYLGVSAALSTNEPIRSTPELDPSTLTARTGNSLAFALLSLFPSLTDTAAAVPDPTIAVGPSHVLAAVNSRLIFYSKERDSLFATSLATWFASVLAPSAYDCGPHQPRLLYDHFNQRWLLAALATDLSRPQSHLLFAASLGRDPTGDWYIWALDISQNGPMSSGFAATDLIMGINDKTVTLSVNHFDQSGLGYGKLRLLSSQEIAGGGVLHWRDIWKLQTQPNAPFDLSLAPAIDFEHDGTIYCIANNPNEGETLNLWYFQPNSSEPRCREFPIRPYRKPDRVYHVESGSLLDLGDARIQSAVKRTDTLWVAFTSGGVNTTSPGSHLRIIGIHLSGGGILVDKPAVVYGESFFMPSLTVDQNNEVVVFHQSLPSKGWPALEAFVFDPNRSSEHFAKASLFVRKSPASVTATTNAVRFWGQRTGVALDPENSKTFWGIGELYETSTKTEWRAWIGAIEICDCKPDLMIDNVASALVLERGKSKTLNMTLRNFGNAYADTTALGIYFSTDTLLSAGDDTLLEVRANALNPIEFQKLAPTHHLDSHFPASEGFLLFVADHRQILEEANEANNLVAVPVTIVDALACDLAFNRPALTDKLCPDTVHVEVALKISGGKKPYNLKCLINGSPASICTDTLVAADIDVSSLPNELTAQIIVQDALGLQETCIQSIPINKTSPLQIDVKITAPAANDYLCKGVANITGKVELIDGHHPFITLCLVNGKPVSVINGRFAITDTLTASDSLITAICSASDSCSASVRVPDSVPVKIDPASPVITWGYSPAYPFIKGVVRDVGSGLQSLTAFPLVNARFSHDSFIPGAHEVKFEINPIDATRPIGFIITAVDRAGCKAAVDPLVVRLSPDFNDGMMTFSVPRTDHYLNIENHGLASIKLTASGHVYDFVAAPAGSEREPNKFYIPREGGFTVDLEPLWQSENIEVTLSAVGAAERYAFVIFSDQPWDFTTQLERPPQQAALPEHFALLPNYPNPFNPETRLRFEIPAGDSRRATLRIYNSFGQLVTTLLESTVAPGFYELPWFGLNSNGQRVSSGVYFYVLQAGDFRASRKMTLTK